MMSLCVLSLWLSLSASSACTGSRSIRAEPVPASGQSRRHRRQHLQPPGTPPPLPARPATSLQLAVLEGVEEDHAYEQYFFDEPTRISLLRLMSTFARPLLLCTPSLAMAAEAAAHPYLLLERDERFSFLSSYRPYDLFNPGPAPPFDPPCDAVICDPPFANCELPTLREALDALYASLPTPLPPCHANGSRARQSKPPRVAVCCRLSWALHASLCAEPLPCRACACRSQALPRLQLEARDGAARRTERVPTSARP
jgi:hypothetical protein